MNLIKVTLHILIIGCVGVYSYETGRVKGYNEAIDDTNEKLKQCHEIIYG